MLISLNNIKIKKFKDVKKIYDGIVNHSSFKKYELIVMYNPIAHEITGGMSFKRSIKKNLENGCIFITLSNKDFKNFTEMKYFHMANQIKMMIRLHNVQEDF